MNTSQAIREARLQELKAEDKKLDQQRGRIENEITKLANVAFDAPEKLAENRTPVPPTIHNTATMHNTVSSHPSNSRKRPAVAAVPGCTSFSLEGVTKPRKRACFSQERRKLVGEMRKRSACLRCRILKIPVRIA